MLAATQRDNRIRLAPSTIDQGSGILGAAMSAYLRKAVVREGGGKLQLLAKSGCTEILLEAVHIRLGILRFGDRPTMPEEDGAIHCVTQPWPAVRRGDG